MNIEQITTLISQDMSDVDHMICDKLHSEITLINKLTHYIISGGGKRIRPMISVLIAKSLDYIGKDHITIATLIEFLHTATLLHDDVVDESTMRRGRITANIAFGNAASILVGDFIYTRAFQMMTSLRSLRLLQLMSEAVQVMAEGEVLQLMHCNNPDISIEHYMKIIYGKTARLFEVASQSSAVLARANAYQESALRDYGRYLGTAFQLTDDLLDYVADDRLLGKQIGHDLLEGKPTFPLLHAMRHGTPKQVSLIRQAIILRGNGRKFLDTVLKTMHECDSLGYTRHCAKIEAEKAIACLNCLSYSPYRSALESLVHVIVQRHF